MGNLTNKKVAFSIIVFVVSIFLSIIGIIVVKTIQNKDRLEDKTEIKLPEENKLKVDVIGKTLQGRDISLYSYGNGSQHILLVGGIHGGYEWNSTMLAYKVIDYFDLYSEMIPKNLTIDIIPTLNPDGLYKVTGKSGKFELEDISTNQKVLDSGRFNSNNVDINRNFDCNWQEKSTWKSKEVSAGSKPFSEKESLVFKDLVINLKPSAVIFWHSQGNGVYASKCNGKILSDTIDLMNIYSEASGYKAIKEFDAYPVTGAAEDWLASINVPAVTVELKTHQDVEFEKNIDGVKAVINKFIK